MDWRRRRQLNSLKQAVRKTTNPQITETGPFGTDQKLNEWTIRMPFEGEREIDITLEYYGPEKIRFRFWYSDTTMSYQKQKEKELKRSGTWDGFPAKLRNWLTSIRLENQFNEVWSKAMSLIPDSVTINFQQ